MAASKKGGAKATKDEDDGGGSAPRFPYTPRPGALRKLLALIPEKPKPGKVAVPLLKNWGVLTSNDSTPIAVLKKIGLIEENGTPSPSYAKYMGENGGAELGRLLRASYPEFFESHATPAEADDDAIKRFFRINGGGSGITQRRQVDTFKILAEFATFGADDTLERKDTDAEKGSGGEVESGGKANRRQAGDPSIHIDLHIRLPENKSKAEYDAIIESIAQHIYGVRKP